MNPQQMHMMHLDQRVMQMRQSFPDQQHPMPMHPHQIMMQQQQQHQMMLQQQQQHAVAQQPSQARQPEEDKVLVKVKELIEKTLRDKWNLTLKEASHKLYANGMLDMGKQTNDVNQGSNFESNLEDFYATLDQVEVALRCAIDCHQQAQSSNCYMQVPPNPSRLESTSTNPDEFLSYPQYIAVAKKQIAYANDIKQIISQATTDVVEQRQTLPTQQQQQTQPPAQQQQVGQQQQQQPPSQQMGGQQQQMSYPMAGQQPQSM